MGKKDVIFIICKYNTVESTELQELLFSHGFEWRDSGSTVNQFENREHSFIRLKVYLTDKVMVYGTLNSESSVLTFLENGSYLDSIGTFYSHRYNVEKLSRMKHILTYKNDMIAQYDPRQIKKSI